MIDGARLRSRAALLPRCWGRALLDALFPLRCGACEAWLETGAAASADHWARILCSSCRAALRLIEGPLCPLCGRPFASEAVSDHPCGACLARPPVYAMARSAGIYGPPLKTLIQGLKYRGRLRVAEPLGEILGDAFRRYWRQRPVDSVVPVPLHRRRLRERGFNQVRSLLRRWPDLDRGSPPPTVVAGLLVRVRDTASQAGLDRRQRRRNVRAAFRVRDPDAVQGRSVLLVDDVMTTGATVTACAEALLRGGARRVDVLTLARAL